MKLPIWIASWEIECCQPNATVGKTWTTFPILNPGTLPWWADDATTKIPDDVIKLGTITMPGTLQTLDGRTTITNRGITIPIHGDAHTTPIHGRLIVDAHVERRYPITGSVQRVRGIGYHYDRTGLPVSQLPPVELRTTATHREPTDPPLRISNYLIDLQVDENHN